MPDDKHDARSGLQFVLTASAVSIVLGGLVWIAPSPIPGYTMRDSLILVPVLSVMVAALGVGWRRKLLYIAITLVGFVTVDLLTLKLGVAKLAVDPRAYGVDAPRTILLALAEVFVVAYPIVLLILFVGSKPGVLWTKATSPSDE